MKILTLCFVSVLFGCTRSWTPTPLIDGYQIMVMNSQEAYVANAANELVLGPVIESIGIGRDVIVVDCGQNAITVNGFANTVGFNIIDTKTGATKKRLTHADVVRELAADNQQVPQMRALSSYVK